MWRRVLVAVLCWPVWVHAGCSRALRVPFEDWRPYSYMDGARHTGLETELLDAVAREAGCRVVYVGDVPHNRRQLLLSNGQLDLLLAATPKADAGWYTQPYRDERLSMFVRAGEGRDALRSVDDVLRAGLRLITHRGPANAPAVQEFIARGQVAWFETYARGIELLQQQRGDVLLGDRLAVLHAARAARLSLTELPVPLVQGVVAYRLSPKTLTESDLQTLNAAILRLEARGDLRRIRARWLAGADAP